MDQRPVQPEHTLSREPLGDDFTDRDRQFDQLISRTIGEVTSPPGLTDRVVAASLEELRRTTGPIPFPVGRVRTRSVAAQWLAMAACLGLLVAGGWLVMQSTAPRAATPTGGELVASDPMPVDVTPVAISPAAELVLLETSRPAAFDDLSNSIKSFLPQVHTMSISSKVKGDYFIFCHSYAVYWIRQCVLFQFRISTYYI